MRSATTRSIGVFGIGGSPLGRSALLAVCGSFALALATATPVAAQSPVFDDEELTRGFLRGLVGVATADGVLTGDRAASESFQRIGTGAEIGRRKGETPCVPGERGLYDSVVPAVVAVSSIHTCERCSDWHLGGTGSGWILSPDGLVVTNHHVIERDKGHRLGVMTADGQVWAVTEVVAADPVGDAVVLRIDTRGKRLPFVSLGAAPACGAPVSVVSHPVGRYWCLTEGVVSRFHRQAAPQGEPAVENALHGGRPAVGAASKPVWMSITADYTVGSSGGPVFNAAGEVVGMVARTVTSSNPKRDEANPRRRPLAGETIVFKDCVSTETLRRLVAGIGEDAGDRSLATAGR